MNSTNSTPPTLPAHRRLAAGFWASAMLVVSIVSLLGPTIGSAAGAAANRCGPLEDTIDYIIWLLTHL